MYCCRFGKLKKTIWMNKWKSLTISNFTKRKVMLNILNVQVEPIQICKDKTELNAIAW